MSDNPEQFSTDSAAVTQEEGASAKGPSLRSQSTWLLAAKVTGFFLSSLLPLLVVRFMPMDEVGVYRQAFQVITNAVGILPFGVSMSAYYFLNRNDDRRSAAITNILLFNLAVGAIACSILFLFPQILGSIFRNTELTALAPSIGLVIWLWVFSAFLETVAVANQEPKKATAFIIFAQFTKTLFMVTAAVVFSSVQAFIWAALLQGFVQTAVLFLYLRSRFPSFWRSFDPGFFKEHLSYALPFGFAATVWILQNDIHNYFVGYRFSPSEYAIYAYGCFELPLISMIWESVNSVLIPRMSSLQQLGEKKEMFRLAATASQKQAFIFLPLYVFLVITAHTFITTLFTANYAASVPIFTINLTILPLYVWINDPIVRAYKELGNFLLRLRVLTFIGMITILYFGMDHFDLKNMIAVVVGTVLIEKTILTTVVIRKLEIKTSDLSIFKNMIMTGFAALLSGAVMFPVYYFFADQLMTSGIAMSRRIFPVLSDSIHNFIGGAVVLGICGAIFMVTYLLFAKRFDLFDATEKEFLKKLIPFSRSVKV